MLVFAQINHFIDKTSVFSDSIALEIMACVNKQNLSHQGMKINTDWEVSHVYNRKSGQILFGDHEAMSTFLEDIHVTGEMIDEAIQIAVFRSLCSDRGVELCLSSVAVYAMLQNSSRSVQKKKRARGQKFRINTAMQQPGCSKEKSSSLAVQAIHQC